MAIYSTDHRPSCTSCKVFPTGYRKKSSPEGPMESCWRHEAFCSLFSNREFWFIPEKLIEGAIRTVAGQVSVSAQLLDDAQRDTIDIPKVRPAADGCIPGDASRTTTTTTRRHVHARNHRRAVEHRVHGPR